MLSRLKRVSANAPNESIKHFYNVLLDAKFTDGVDVEKYIYPSGTDNIFYDVAADLGLVVFTGHEGSKLVDAIVSLGETKKKARDIAIDLLADFDGVEYAKQVVNNKGGQICYVFDPEEMEIMGGYDDTYEIIIQDAIDEVLEYKNSELLQKLERDFYKEHPEYVTNIL